MKKLPILSLMIIKEIEFKEEVKEQDYGISL